MFRCLFNKKDEVIDIKALEKINVKFVENNLI